MSHKCIIENAYYDEAKKMIIANGEIGEKKVALQLWSVSDFTFGGKNETEEMKKLADIFTEKYRGREADICSEAEYEERSGE